MNDRASRNLRMAERIGASAVHYPYSFVIAGDSGAWPDPRACRGLGRWAILGSNQ
jgi:hypothetical protein